jgi:hypothetical protein
LKAFSAPLNRRETGKAVVTALLHRWRETFYLGFSLCTRCVRGRKMCNILITVNWITNGKSEV